MSLFVEHDPAGLAIVRVEAELTADDRSDLRKTIYKLLAQCPAAIIVDLSAVSQVPPLIQMTLLALVVEASREPATPMLLCAPNSDVARSLSLNGPSMQVLPSVTEARRALATTPFMIEWFQRPLGRSQQAPSVAANHLASACVEWKVPELEAPAKAVAFDLVTMARGPYELHMTVSLRLRQVLLINVRNYVMADRSAREHVRMRLSPAARDQVLRGGAISCGQLVTSAGVAWWASLVVPASSELH
jgi:anti-anti-sigma regulatory factor